MDFSIIRNQDALKLILKIKSYMEAVAIKWFEFHISFN